MLYWIVCGEKGVWGVVGMMCWRDWIIEKLVWFYVSWERNYGERIRIYCNRKWRIVKRFWKS